jgi:hypothetical protein
VSRGEIATAMLKAILAGKDYPPEGVPNTAHNREMWERMKREIEDLPPGTVVDIPSDWAEWPD